MVFALFLVVCWVTKKVIDHIYDRRDLFWPDYDDLALQATFFHSDLGDKILEMMDDDLTTYSDWEDLLPICIYADRWFYTTHPYVKPRYPREQAVKDIMKQYI